MLQRWETLTFLHWRFEAATVQRLLPPGLRVETADGAAWVGLVPFLMRVGRPPLPPVPWASIFCETNVRTYVRDAHGHSGIWFFSLDAARLGAVVVARTNYRLPYYWSSMTLDRQATTVDYRCRRRWPGPGGAHSRAVVEVGEAYRADALRPLDHFLTARWLLFSVSGNRRRLGRASHQPWPLHRARVVELDDELIGAAGLPTRTEDPLVHFSPGVDVRIGPFEPWLTRLPLDTTSPHPRSYRE
ncbi:MAG: DUF2071 domain-containing protein [Acidimicrobiales bacterium]|nr:MAG: DUF2071 domain-containing protein [Acidimicrobiales bacterium]